MHILMGILKISLGLIIGFFAVKFLAKLVFFLAKLVLRLLSGALGLVVSAIGCSALALVGLSLFIILKMGTGFFKVLLAALF